MVYRGLVDQFNGTLEVFLNAEANVTFEIAYALRQEGIEFGLECTAADSRARFDICVFRRGLIVCVVEVKRKRTWTWQKAFYSTYGHPLVVCMGKPGVKKTIRAVMQARCSSR
jgi:hypothetical protein